MYVYFLAYKVMITQMRICLQPSWEYVAQEVTLPSVRVQA